MKNIDFIRKYGKLEFRDMCKYITQELYLARADKKIGGFKINNSKKYVKFYRKDKESVNLEFATIYSIGCNRLKQYIESK